MSNKFSETKKTIKIKNEQMKELNTMEILNETLFARPLFGLVDIFYLNSDFIDEKMQWFKVISKITTCYIDVIIFDISLNVVSLYNCDSEFFDY